MDISTACTIIKDGVHKYYEDKSRVTPCRVNRASALGHPCLRCLVYSRTNWRDRRKPSPELQAIFTKGNDEERLLKAKLAEMGFTVEEGQLTLEEPEYQLSGHIDGCIGVTRGTDEGYFLVEIKSMAPYRFDSISTWRDFLTSPIYSRWPAQGQIYMLMREVSEMLFIIINKSSGELKVLPMELDYGYAESLLQKCEAINKHIDEGTLPDRIPYDDRVCGQYCDFYHICLPPMTGEGTTFANDPEMAEKLQRRHELKEAAAEFKKVDDALKVKMRGIENTVIGDFYCTGKWIKTRKKATEASTSKYWKRVIRPLAE